ncbi:flagellar hook-basal body complex protein FliE [Alkalithermobacter thermoalcaliphilus JW-YL-7 = DSM 7308]|uniref:Flagellar hook-basal body complex protein FliE n=1 Tax=Alkalithermobacter thermoalcaliphilus JW-YL-7 = DSM 7308 TaxID=1121328 RepID=A0A150FQ74_CLOPD|nr:Flagellar hook-basal body complex protein fliE [[Clostridium] paradoxum JW-YL-7 = DSM 7308]SHK61595.1 flagellar hook-basal body complex protein FliE [[Clostridium] paradoxum JW-YL-7 = DSM 7308]
MNVNNVNKAIFNIGKLGDKLNTQSEKNISFGDFLKNSLYKVSAMEKQADKLNEKFITGEIENIHDLTIATQKADIAIQAFVEVKNKVIEAYKEIMRMQI